MFLSLSSIVPNAADLLSLDVEEMAGVPLMHLNTYDGVSGNSIYQNGKFCRSNFLTGPSAGLAPLRRASQNSRPDPPQPQGIAPTLLAHALRHIEEERAFTP